MKFLALIFLLILSSSASASFPEYFGTGPTTSSIGNQGNQDIDDASNIYYLPALSAWSQKVSISATASIVTHSFKPITNVVTQNSTNGQTGSSVKTGAVDTNYGNSTNTVISLILPLRKEKYGAASIVFSSPIGSVLKTNSGNPTLPEYAMYRARYRRTQLHANYALPINEHWAVSLGAHIGFQASARVSTQVSLGNAYGSSGSAKTKIDPSLGAIASVAYKSDQSLYGFTFQQEMKSNLDAVATGDISNPPLTLINIGLKNMIYYDPRIFRLSYSKAWKDFEAYATVEYQMWKNYKAPLIKIQNLGGSVRSSNDYEHLKLRNIIVPKIGIKWKATQNLALLGGALYRQTPFDSDFSGAGNTIDTSSLILTSGITYDFDILGQEVQLGASAQYHKLSNKTVIKTNGQENGSTGQKIGAPGYNIGGHVFMAMSGIRVLF